MASARLSLTSSRVSSPSALSERPMRSSLLSVRAMLLAHRVGALVAGVACRLVPAQALREQRRLRSGVDRRVGVVDAEEGTQLVTDHRVSKLAAGVRLTQQTHHGVVVDRD